MVDELPSTSMVPMGSGLDAVTLPSKLTITRGPGTFELSWRWKDQVPRGVFLTPLAGGAASLPSLMHAWPLAGIAGVTAIVAFAIAAWHFNVMRVRVTQGVLEVSVKPLSFTSMEIVAADIDGIVVVPTAGKKPSRFGVVAVLHSGKRKQIVSPILTEEQAQAIGGFIREALNPSASAALAGEVTGLVRK